MSFESEGQIHILGLGNLGILFAHALAKEKALFKEDTLSKGVDPPLVTLLFHRRGLLDDWSNAERQIEITTGGIPETSSDYYIDINHILGDTYPIQNLIVATKSYQTAFAIEIIKDRLSCNSTILFAQNGMGTIDEVNEKVFPDPAERPNYLACIAWHGIYSQGPFRSVHAGVGNAIIGRVGDSKAPQYLIDKIVQAKTLAAEEVPPNELLRLTLEKLVGNAMINPLTVIFNCRNGELFDKNPVFGLMVLLLKEASQVIRSLPELAGDPETASRFSVKSLEAGVLDLAKRTAENTSSMLQDVRAGRQTEIDYINGYIIERGKELGIECKNNEKVVKMIKEGKQIQVDEISKYFPAQ